MEILMANLPLIKATAELIVSPSIISTQHYKPVLYLTFGNTLLMSRF